MQANKMGATTRQLKLLLLVIKKKYIDFCFIYFFPKLSAAWLNFLLSVCSISPSSDTYYCISLDALTAVIPCDIERVDF